MSKKILLLTIIMILTMSCSFASNLLPVSATETPTPTSTPSLTPTPLPTDINIKGGTLGLVKTEFKTEFEATNSVRKPQNPYDTFVVATFNVTGIKSDNNPCNWQEKFSLHAITTNPVTIVEKDWSVCTAKINNLTNIISIELYFEAVEKSIDWEIRFPGVKSLKVEIPKTYGKLAASTGTVSIATVEPPRPTDTPAPILTNQITVSGYTLTYKSSGMWDTMTYTDNGERQKITPKSPFDKLMLVVFDVNDPERFANDFDKQNQKMDLEFRSNGITWTNGFEYLFYDVDKKEARFWFAAISNSSDWKLQYNGGSLSINPEH